MSDLDPLAAQRQRIADTERVRRAKLAALEAQGRQAQPAPVPPTRRSERPLDPIEAKRQRMAAALERKQSRQLARPRAQVVILVKPNLRRLRQLRREAAARAQQEGAGEGGEEQG